MLEFVIQAVKLWPTALQRLLLIIVEGYSALLTMFPDVGEVIPLQHGQVSLLVRNAQQFLFDFIYVFRASGGVSPLL